MRKQMARVQRVEHRAEHKADGRHPRGGGSLFDFIGCNWSLSIVLPLCVRIYMRLNCFVLVYVAPSTKATQCWLA